MALFNRELAVDEWLMAVVNEVPCCKILVTSTYVHTWRPPRGRRIWVGGRENREA